MEMYFVALVAPDPIHQQVLKWKNYMKENFGCVVALRSPAHITLIPPFWMSPDLEQDLRKDLNSFSSMHNRFQLTLENFSSFKPSVIFVNIARNESLQQLKSQLDLFLSDQNRYPIKKEDRPFHPHMTIATRDLYKKAYQEAWKIFQEKKYKAEWLVNEISLLRHNKKNWDVIFTSQLGD